MHQPSFIIHHLTDIHLGPAHYSANVPEWFKENRGGSRNMELYLNHLRRLTERLDRDRERLPDLVVISGDLTSFGAQQEVNLASDSIGKIVRLMRSKRADWRVRDLGRVYPFVLIVPGNHDLDWRKPEHVQKIEPFARMADSLCNTGEVLSSNYQTLEQHSFCDFGEDANLFVYLLDSTHLGGIEDPAFKFVHEQLSEYQRVLNGRTGDTADAILADALVKLQKYTRRDPGYVRQDALDKMRNVLDGVPPGRMKIAVLHHNPTTLPSDDVDPFDVIVNAGRVKQALAMCGFDVVLFGHRHLFHCSQERLQVPRGRQRSLEAELAQGTLFVAGDTLGCKPHAPFVEFSLRDLPAHQYRLPVCLLSLTLWRNEKGEYEPDAEPAVQCLLSTPIYTAIDRVFRNIGRTEFLPTDREHLRDDLKRLLPAIHQLRWKMLGWSSDAVEWIQNFHSQLDLYKGIYATDLYDRSNAQSVYFSSYLRQQYIARMCRLRRQRESVPLKFSPAVYDAICRTGWQPSEVLWEGRSIEACESAEQWNLEIARILIQPLAGMSVEDYELLEQLNFYHRLFAIPLFVLEPEHLASDEVVDIAVAVNEQNNPIRAFEYDSGERRVRERGAPRRSEVHGVFFRVLQHSSIVSVRTFLEKSAIYAELPRDRRCGD